MNNEKRTFLDFLMLLTKWRKSIIINFIVVAVVSLIISFQMTEWYRATAVIMPPAGQSAGGLSSLLNSLPIASLGLGGGGGSETTYMAILKSKSLATDVIKKYDLQEFYERQTLYETYLSFYGDYDVQFTEENMIAISFEYTNPVKVAEIVNYIVNKLSLRSTELMIERATRTKKQIEKRYLQNLRDIDSLSIAMEMFNKKHGIIEFESQTKALIEMTAKIESEIFIKTAEVKAIESSFGKESPQLRTSKIELDILKKQFKELTENKFQQSDDPFASLFISLKDLPELSREYANLYANFLLQAKLQEYLLPEYEQAKLQVQKDDPTLQILDEAVAPDKKSRPKKAFVVLGAVIVALVLHLLVLLLIENINWMKESNPKRYADFEKLKKSWSGSSKKG